MLRGHFRQHDEGIGGSLEGASNVLQFDGVYRNFNLHDLGGCCLGGQMDTGVFRLVVFCGCRFMSCRVSLFSVVAESKISMELVDLGTYFT
jgi:hypothetical protein